MFVSIVISTVCGRAKWDKPRIMNNEKGGGNSALEEIVRGGNSCLRTYL